MRNYIYKFWYIILGLLILLIGIIIFLKRDRIIIIDGVNGVFTYNGKWKYNRKFEKYDSKKFNIYSGTMYLGNYKMKYGSGWVVYSSSEIIPYDYDLIATNSDSIEVVSYNEENEGYDSIVMQFLSSRNLNSSEYYYTAYNYDFDNDGINEQLFFLSNFSMQCSEDKLYSFVFIYNDDKFYPIKQSITNDLEKIELYSFGTILDNDGHIQFIVTTDLFSQPDKKCQELFEYDRGVKKLYKCK